MAKMSPTQLTLRELRKRDMTAAVVERWNHVVKIRQDLFGCIDVLAVGEQGTVAVQACSYGDVSKRVKKIADNPALPDMRRANWTILVWGWRKVKNRWEFREVDVS